MASGSDWSFEKVRIRDSDYSAKCGITGECYFWVSKGTIKITQVDNKTSVQYSVTKIRCVAEIFCKIFNNSVKEIGERQQKHFSSTWVAACRRDKGDWRCITRSLGEIFAGNQV